MSGACIPPLFLCVSLLIDGVHTGFPFGLTIFSSHHMFPQVLKDSSTDVSLSPAPGCGGYCIPGPPAQDQLTNPQDWAHVPCPLTPCAQKPQPRGSSRSGCRVRITWVSHISVKLTRITKSYLSYCFIKYLGVCTCTLHPYWVQLTFKLVEIMQLRLPWQNTHQALKFCHSDSSLQDMM